MIVVLYSVQAAQAGADVVWQIGQTDHDFHDLILPGDLNKYASLFPQDVNFVIGKSDPTKDFCAIHPGPVDSWAGRREHLFRIRFDMAAEPSGIYELQINLVDTHNFAPPTLRISVNGKVATKHLHRGVGGLSLLRAKQGKARHIPFVFGADHLKQGTNEIELSVTTGAWVLYDSLILRRLPADARPEIKMDVKPTLFYVKKEGGLKQEFTLLATGLLSSKPAKVEIGVAKQRIERTISIEPSLGLASTPIYIEPTDKPRELTFTLTIDDQRAKATCTQKPTKKWRIFSVPSTHTDIGYTDIQARVIDMHNRNTDLALQLIGDYPLYHWNLESSWAAQMWLKKTPQYRHEELYKASRERRLAIESSYLNMLTGLCSGEELIRNMYYSARMQREHGIPFVSHTITDAPSHVWTVPSILSGAGIRCVSLGINTVRAPVLKQNIHHKSPFWWEGPDGKRVLTWFSEGYAKARHIGLKDGAERMRVMIERYLSWWDSREDYPYDALLLHGAYGDNAPIGEDIAKSLTEYTKRYAYPKVTLGANNDFADYIIKNFADKIPVVRGCGGSWWEDGAASSAVETAICRVAHQDIIAAETIWAAVAVNDKYIEVPQRTFDRVWDNILLYDEHTWGAHNSIREPDKDFVRRQFAVKAAYATDAAKDTKQLLDGGLRQLAGMVGGEEGSIVVFNPSGKPRSGLVEVEVPRETLILGEKQLLPQQRIHEDVLRRVVKLIRVEDVPAVGYRAYPTKANRGVIVVVPPRFEGRVLQNDYYRVEFDPVTGGIVSLKDQKLDKELVDQSSPYKMGQVIYATGGEENKGQTQIMCPNPSKVQYISPKEAKLEAGVNGPVFSSAKATSSIEMFPRIELEVILYHHEKRIDFVYRLRKNMTYDKEALYIAFPIAGRNPQFRYEIGGGNVRPNKDQFPGSCRDWYSVQRWVTVNTDDRAVVWTPVDTPLISLCDMNAGKWLDELSVTNGTIFAYAMNNYWFTNYKAGQDGDFEFRYSLTSDTSIDPTTATLFGESVVNPMRAIQKRPGLKAGPLPDSKSFVQVKPENVVIGTVKPADDGKGIIVRVQETAGRDTEVTLHIGFDKVTKARFCDLVERDQDSLKLHDKKVEFKIQANSMGTVRLQ